MPNSLGAILQENKMTLAYKRRKASIATLKTKFFDMVMKSAEDTGRREPTLEILDNMFSVHLKTVIQPEWKVLLGS